MAAALEPPLFVIVGPTASGKTAAAIRLARQLDGEIVCADSRTVYRGLDIGTAKPTFDERRLVPHHLLDVVNPDESYNVAQFQGDARSAIGSIRQRGKTPLLVGGSGLYIDGIVFDYEFTTPPDAVRRTELEAMTLDELLHYGYKNNIKMPDNLYNKRYVIRAIEQGGVNDTRSAEPINNTFIVGITTDKDVLHARMVTRATAMVQNGVLAEAERMAAIYGWECPPLQAPVYRLSRRLIEHTMTVDDAVMQLARSDWQLARKQLTWFRRNSFIGWRPLEQVDDAVRSILAQ
jgi:tRNA dimethylallyltransferase